MKPDTVCLKTAQKQPTGSTKRRMEGMQLLNTILASVTGTVTACRRMPKNLKNGFGEPQPGSIHRPKQSWETPPPIRRVRRYRSHNPPDRPQKVGRRPVEEKPQARLPCST